MCLHMKPDIDSDISLSAVTDVFCILRDVTMCCITVGFNNVSDQLKVIYTGHGSSSYTLKRRVYVFVCLFSLSAKKLTNRLTQTRKIGNDCRPRVNFSWSSEHIFNFLRFVIQKL